MKNIKQSLSWSCMACIGAMITGDTEEAFFASVGHNGEGVGKMYSDKPFKEDSGFTWQELSIYLTKHGYTLGAIHLDDELDFNGKLPIDLRVTKDYRIIYRVISNLYEDERHVIYWDGEELHDPSPYANVEPVLSDYKVTGIVPIMRWVDK